MSRPLTPSMQLAELHDPLLFWLARRRRPRIKRWFSSRFYDGRRHYTCYLCDAYVTSHTTDMTMLSGRALLDLTRHRAEHIAELTGDPYPAMRAALAAGAPDVAADLYNFHLETTAHRG